VKKILTYILKACPFYFIILSVLAFAAGMTTPLAAWIETDLINTVVALVESSFTWNGEVVFLLAGLLIVYAVEYTLPALSGFLQQVCTIKLDKIVKVEIQNKINRLDYKTLEEPAFRDKWNRIAGKLEEKIPEWFTAVFDFFAVIVGVTGLFAYVASVSVKIMLFYTVELAVLFCMSRLAEKAMFSLNKKFSSSERRVLYLNEITNNKDYVAERKLFQYTPFINRKRTEFMNGQREGQRKHDFKFAVCSSGIDVMGYIATIVIIIMMTPQLMNHTVTLGFFLAFSRVTLNVNNTMQYRVRTLLDIMAQQQTYWREYRELIDAEEKGSAGSGGNIKSFDTIEFRNVSFTYPNGTQVLQNTSFHIKKGKHYALIGENGAGKSTIVKLLLGLYAPTSGEILIDGRNINGISRSELQEICAVVFQDFARYAITFEENVTLNRPFDEKKFSGVLSYVGLTDVEKNLKDGRHTMLGKIERDGKDLSGGEWQKLAIARALYRGCPFVIFDEPTASLDPVAESRLYHQYYDMMKGKTTVFISHRLASATLADEILVLADKRIRETGTHEELMAKKGVYHKLFMAQRRWYWGEVYGNE